MEFKQAKEEVVSFVFLASQKNFPDCIQPGWVACCWFAETAQEQASSIPLLVRQDERKEGTPCLEGKDKAFR